MKSSNNDADKDGGAQARLERRLLRQISQLNREFDLIAENDRVMVALSGGKDSWSMLHLLRRYQKVVPFGFDIIAVNLDQGQPNFDVSPLRDYLEAQDYDYRLVHEDTYPVVRDNTPAGKAYCSLCSRLRRGVLYRVATELGATKIALGHHRDDVIETLCLNLFWAGQMKSMPPRLRSDDGRNTIIRPLAYCAEAQLAELAAKVGFPILPCDLCGSQEQLKRKQVKAWLAELERGHPQLRTHMMSALGNIKTSHLYDRNLFTLNQEGEQEGDHDGDDRSDHAVAPVKKGRSLPIVE